MTFGLGIGLGITIGSAAQGGGGPAPLTPLDPDLASQPMKVAVSTRRRVRAAYGTGQQLQVRDSGNTLRTLNFNADGTPNAPAATWAAFGNGVDFTVATLNDQSGNAIHFTSAARPILRFPNAPTSYDGAYLDYTGAVMNLATTLTPIDIGGTANLTVFVVHRRLGYGSGSSPMPRPGTPSASAISCLVGYGPSSGGGQLITAVPTTGNDPIGGQTECVYNKPKFLGLDESVPGSIGWEVTWFNQKGALVTGGGDTRKHWVDHKHGVAASAGNRLVLGASNSLAAAFNGYIAEMIVFQSATPMQDDECQRIAMWLDNYYACDDTSWDWRYWIVGWGQSNIANQFVDSGSGDGTAGSASMSRRLIPKLAAYTGIPAGRFTAGIGNRTCVGGTPVLKRPDVGSPVNPIYWNDEDTDSGGNLMTGICCGGATVTVISAVPQGGAGYQLDDILTVVGGTPTAAGHAATLRVATLGAGGAIATLTVEDPGNYDVAPAANAAFTGGSGTGALLTTGWVGGLYQALDAVEELPYQKIIIVGAIAEQDSATITTGEPRRIQWANQWYAAANRIRVRYGQPDAPIIAQPVSRYADGVDSNVQVVAMNRLQQSIVAAGHNVFLAPDTGLATRGDSNNWSAHFGSLNAFDATTGGAEDGYQRVGWQDGLTAAAALGANVKWKGPEVTALAKTASNKAVFTLTYPPECGGADISTPSGTIGGFHISDASGAELTISSVAKLSATQIEVTTSTAIPAGFKGWHDPLYSSGVTIGVNVRNQLRDNNPDINLGVRTSQLLVGV